MYIVLSKMSEKNNKIKNRTKKEQKETFLLNEI